MAGTSDPSNLFQQGANYQEMLDKGISLSGEDQEFFIAGRLARISRRVDRQPRRILDFGCGNGLTSRHLLKTFPEAEVVGVDTAEEAIAYANEKFGGPQARFLDMQRLGEQGTFDLCYVNGVFHHIPPARRLAAAQSILRALEPGGRLAFCENNPWNPGTRMVMKRIPFDRDAITLTIPESRQLLEKAGFSDSSEWWSMFFFPKFLSFLRGLEQPLERSPLGAQYCVLARK